MSGVLSMFIPRCGCSLSLVHDLHRETGLFFFGSGPLPVAEEKWKRTHMLLTGVGKNTRN